MNKRQQQKQATRQIIRETAKQFFIAHGFEATTSRQIAKQAGVATGTIFVHFPNKQAILMDILFEDIEKSVTHAFQTLPTNADTVGKLMHIARVLYSYYFQNIEFSRVLLQNNLVSKSGEDAFSAQINAFVNEVAQLLEQGQANLEVSSSKNVTIMARTFFAAYFSGLVLLVQENSLGVEESVSELEEMTRIILN